MRYEGARWLRSVLTTSRKPQELSDFGAEVAEIVGFVWRGIYHLPQGAIERGKWEGDDLIEFTIWGDLATYDRNDLTELVLLCHERSIRLSVQPAMRNLRLLFHRRKREGQMHERHPLICQAIDDLRRASEGTVWSGEYEEKAP